MLYYRYMSKERGRGNPDVGKAKNTETTPASLETQRFVHQPIEKLLDVGSLFPADVKKELIPVAKALEPYEEFAAESEGTVFEDKQALIELLDQQGIITPEFLLRFQDIGKGFVKERVAQEQKQLTSSSATQKLLKKQVEDTLRARNSVFQRLEKDKRPLAAAVLHEASSYSYEKTIERMIDRHGLTKVIMSVGSPRPDLAEKDRLRAIQHLSWLQYANTMKHVLANKPPDRPSKAETENQLALLKEVSFSNQETMTVNVFLTGVTEPLQIHVGVSDDLDAFTLAVFTVEFGVTRASGKLSRVTGQIHPQDHFLFTLENHFAYSAHEEHYEFLRSAVIGALEKGYLSGLLKEKVYVEITPSDAPQEATPESAHDDEVVSHESLPDDTNSETADTHDLPDDPQEDALSTKKTRYSTRRLSWRRIMAALKRCGVEIDMSYAHPKLRYEDKVTSYLNSHDKDQKHNKNVLFQTLKQLGISKDEFMAKL